MSHSLVHLDDVVESGMKKPNLFIIGAPKCGTTSLASWLSEHPQVFMSQRKEPWFFNTDDRDVGTPTLELYERLFREATDDHVAVGEASTSYLMSDDAVPNICEYAANPRFVVCLRNPVEMAYSLHDQQLVNTNEDVRDFEEAWRLQDKRRRGDSVPRWCKDPRRLAYGEACSLGQQLERLYSRVDPSTVLPVVLEDMVRDPGHEYRKVLKFLNLDDDGRESFPAHNPAQERKSLLVRNAVLLLARMKNALGVHRGFGVLERIDRGNLRARPRQEMSPGMREELRQFFSDDIAKLGKLLNRDLTAWNRA